ncbi:MAG: PEP-CTERM sorting domain-containing protein [Pirellulales bacterium]|nr:PEP-CTERM sorting domain-containing protein [Pirellulales bacterium]
MKKLICAVLGTCLVAATHASAATLLFDFGSATTPTGGNYNNIDPSQQPILNAIDSSGAPTGIGLTSSGFNELGPNTNGTLAPGGAAAIFDAQATRDNLFGHSTNFNAPSPRPQGLLNLTGLDGSGATAYSFTFFGSRLGVSDNRETAYAVTGANASTVYLDSSNNVNNVAVASGIVPTAGGTVSITVGAGPNNTNTDSFFYYLGAMQIESTRVPEPASIALGVVGLAGVAVRRRLRVS